MQLEQHDLPGAGVEPASSERVFNLCVRSPLANILTSKIYNRAEQVAPNINVAFKSSLNQNTEHQLRYQETEFVISYEEFRRPEFTSIPLFNDEMVLVASRKHPRISGPLLENDVYNEQHAAVSLDRFASFSQPWYDTADKQSCVAYQGMALISVLNIVSQTHLVSIAPRWLAEEFSEQLDLQILPLPLKLNSRTCYLSWHEAAGRDKGHQWMEELLVSVCKQ